MNQARVQTLVRLLTEASDKYYNDPKNVTMSDSEFDKLRDELEGLDPAHPFLSVTGAPAKGFTLTAHARPMASLLKVPNPNGFGTVADWAAASGYKSGEKLCVTEKMDGFSLNLVYRDGVFVQAITRGDGKEGDDITANARLMDFPKRVPGKWSGSIRAEGIIKLSVFNAEFVGEKNPRNSASGTARRQSDNAQCKYITCVGFDVCPDDGDLPSKSEELKLLSNWGFQTPNSTVVSSVAGVEDYFGKYHAKTRKTLDYWIDGLVICYDDQTRRSNLPERNDRPMGAVAYKFPHEEIEATLEGIDWSVGKGGRITPVLMVGKVSLGGADVSRPNAHNLGRIAEMVFHLKRPDGLLRVGDRILVSKRNDVIPYAEECFGGGTAPIAPPTHCPACNHPTKRDGAYLVCNGDACPAQISGDIRRWVEKIGVLHIGGSQIGALIEAGLIEDAADLYTVDRDQVRTVTMGQRVIGNGLERGFKSLDTIGRELDLHVFVGSLGIPSVGRSTCQKIVEAGFDSLDLMMRATVPQLAAIPGVGMAKANAFAEGFWKRLHLIGKLLSAGVTIKKKVTGQFMGMSACVTGFRGKEEQDVVQAFEGEGGTMKSGVATSLTYLICKDPNSGSGKPSKARQFNASGKGNIKVISLDDFWTQVLGKTKP